MKESLDKKKRKNCSFCNDKVTSIDYKDVQKLKKFLNSESGKILPRRMTGICAKHQRMFTNAVKKAREVALLSYTFES